MFTHRFAVEFDAIGVVDETVQNAVGNRGIADLFVPVRHGQLRGEDHRAPVVAVVADLQEIAPFAVSSLHGQALQIWSRINPFLSLALAGILFVIGLLLYSSKRKKHAVRMADWENTWMCLQCGGLWK